MLLTLSQATVPQHYKVLAERPPSWEKFFNFFVSLCFLNYTPLRWWSHSGCLFGLSCNTEMILINIYCGLILYSKFFDCNFIPYFPTTRVIYPLFQLHVRYTDPTPPSPSYTIEIYLILLTAMFRALLATHSKPPSELNPLDKTIELQESLAEEGEISLSSRLMLRLLVKAVS